MAEKEVQVKEVDVIRVYNQKFGDFNVSFCEHMNQFLHLLQDKLETLQQAKNDIKRERARIDEEISEARQRYSDSLNCGSYETRYKPDGSSYSTFVQDYDYIRQCREEYEHISSFIYHNAQICDSLAHNRMVQATEIVNMIQNRTTKIISSFQIYVQHGRQYLDKVVQYIEQYKSTNLNS